MKEEKSTLSFYLRAFQNLRRDYKMGGAPHKPILLLSLIEAFRTNLITSNRVYITPELVGLFKSYWNLLVTSGHSISFALPFYHMKTESFWKIIPNPGCEKWVEANVSMRRFANLKSAIDFVEIDRDLADLFRVQESREILKLALAEKYFPENKNRIDFKNADLNYLNEIGKEMREESSSEYKRKFKKLIERLDKESLEEEVFMRGGAFKREVPKAYNYTCCISGFRIDAVMDVSMVDACHIIPFSMSYDDTIANGVSLGV